MEFARGADDRHVFGEAIRDDRVLVAHDLDFGLISDTAIDKTPAIVLMRRERPKAALRAATFANFLRTIEVSYPSKLYVVEPGSMRIRLLPESGSINKEK